MAKKNKVWVWPENVGPLTYIALKKKKIIHKVID